MIGYNKMQALGELGVRAPDLEAVQRAPYPQSERMLRGLKDRVKKNWRQLAFMLHPDRTQNDPVKTERLKQLTEVKEEFDRVQVVPRMPIPPVVVRRTIHWTNPMHSVGVPFSTTINGCHSTTTSSTTGVHFNQVYVVTMRPR
jgi:hypothetical protein